jgi:dTDP-4-amino-4,6-dideoxygalactose transaminase
MTSPTTGHEYRVTLADNTIGTAEIEAVTEVLRGRWLSAGAVTRQFEAELAGQLGVADAVAVSSGTAALHLAVLALDLRPGDQVIIPSLTFVASAAVTALHGGVPVFADVVSEDVLTLAVPDVRRLLNDRTRAVVVMHYGGYPAAVDEIVALAHERGVPVIEDAAHAPLVRAPDGAMLGTVGDIGCFSFFATKNLTTGEGGLVVARDPDLLTRVREMRSHCVTRSTWDRMHGPNLGYDVRGIGLNYRPTEIAAAIGRVQLARLPEDRTRRGDLVARYRRRLGGMPGVRVPFAAATGDSAHHLMAVLLPAAVSRDDIQERLRASGVQTSVHYPPTHLLHRYRTDAARLRIAAEVAEAVPVTEAVAGRLLSLPLHSRMSVDDVDYVVDRLAVSLADGSTP